ncbi:MAG: hypothetical protein ACE5KA_03160 [Nitrososphaerales archaeon]
MFNPRGIFTIVLLTTIIGNLLTIGTQFSPPMVEAQELQLRVSAAERTEFQNHFFGPQIVQVIMEDPGASDPDESTVGLQVKGTTVPRVHLTDGLWYHFFAEQETFGLLLDVMTDGIRDSRIAVQDGAGGTAGDLVSVSIGDTVTIGTNTYTVTADADSFVREINAPTGTSGVIVEVDQDKIFPTLPIPFNEESSNINPDLSLGSNVCIDLGIEFNEPGTSCDWPYIVMVGINELDIVSIRAGSVSLNLVYDDFAESISSAIDRVEAYPVFAEVIVSYTDFMYNINPVEEDLVSFVLDENDGTPVAILYRFARSHDPAFSTDLLPILFRPTLNFDSRQVFELDSEGVSVLKFYERFDATAVGVFPVAPVIGGVREAANARLVSDPEFTPLTILPAITMIENDPNTSLFESIDEGAGSRSSIFAGSDDKVANFDYFDIINSAQMATSDGFTTVDKELYDSADRAIFTVTDPDQNLRSRVSEQPPARESRTFVKVGNPFPLTNNPILSDSFPTSDPNRHSLKNVLPPVGSSFDIDSIEVALFSLVDDVNADVTTNPDIRGVVNFAGGDDPATRNGVTATLDDFFFNTGDTASTSPADIQLVALQFNNPDIVPGGAFDKASGLIINTAVHLQDLNLFEKLTLTKGQVLRDDTAPSGSTPGAIQAFDIDPFVSAVSIYRTTDGIPTTITDLTTLPGNPTLDVFFPQYNLMQVDLAGLNVGTDDETGERLDIIAVQVEAFRDLNLNGKLDTTDELETTRRTMVDFNSFQDADTDGDGIREIVNLPPIGIGVGSMRVVDLLNFDWDGDGSTIFDNDTDDLRTTADGPILLRVDVTFVDNDFPSEPVKVLDLGTQIAVIDFSGFGAIVTQDPRVLGQIDQITLNEFQNMVYRIQVKEQGSNSSVFTGRMDFMTANQFDTTQKAIQDIVLQGDPARALMPNRFVPPNRLAFSYADINIAQSFSTVSATFVYETRDGKISWDSETYKFGSRAIVTLEDQDLNRRPDSIERYDLPVAGFVFLELGKKRVDDTCTANVNGCFLAFVDATLMETGTNTGIFQAQIEIPPTILLSDGTVSPTRQDDLEINYIDLRDRSSIKQEFDDITNTRTKLGKLLLDRNVYPQGPRLPPNDPLLGAIMYISIVESEVNKDPEVREKFDLTGAVDLSTSAGNANDIRDIFQIKIYNGGGDEPVVYSANLASSFLVGGNAFPILDRKGNQVTEALETGPNTGIFELEFMIYCPDSTPLQPFLPSPICTDTIFDELTKALGLPPILTFKPNSPIEVTYNDPSDDSGTPKDVDTSAVIQGVTAQLGTDKVVYDVGDPATFFFIEPDFNFDSRAVELVDFNFLGITTDKTPVDEVPLGFLLDALHLFQSFSSTEAGFRESDMNSGIFGAIADPGVVDTLVANRGSKIQLVYRDNTPSGGGTSARIEHNVFLNANEPAIIFNKEEYTPFDEVTITVISPDSNFDPFQIDTIVPSVSTSSDRGFGLEISETGPDSRIFEEDIILTPDKGKFPGDLIAKREDGLTVEFRIDSKTVVSKSAFLNYHVGIAMFEKQGLQINERAIVGIIDPDENLNPNTIDTVSVRLWSTTDRGGLSVTLRETGDRTGVFEEFITFTNNEESSGTRLRASEGDTIIMKYTDRTLPAPAALDKDGIFTVTIEELLASALIESPIHPLERAVLKEPKPVDLNGLAVEQVKVDMDLLIQSEITNAQMVRQKFVYIVLVKDSVGVTTSLSWLTGELPPKDSIVSAQSWIPTSKGNYQIEVFVWESIHDPNVLTPNRILPITVS